MTPADNIKRTPTERLAALETRMDSLATLASVAVLTTAVHEWHESNTKQHSELRQMLETRVFSSAPNSVEGRLTAIEERSFGDNPTSLKSQLVEIHGQGKWLNGWIAGVFAFLGGTAAFIGLKWDEIAKFFHAVFEPK